MRIENWQRETVSRNNQRKFEGNLAKTVWRREWESWKSFFVLFPILAVAYQPFRVLRVSHEHDWRLVAAVFRILPILPARWHSE